MRDNNSLYGSPATEKIGSFCDSTSELKISIIGIPVRIMFLGTIRFEGLTDGPPMAIILSRRAGPLSRGSPLPEKIRPSRFSEKDTCMGCFKNRTRSLVETPRLPARTCSDTLLPSSRMTWASDTPCGVAISANSPYPIPSASTVITSPAICMISL